MSGYLALRTMDGNVAAQDELLNNNNGSVGSTNERVQNAASSAADSDRNLYSEELLLAVKAGDEARLQHALKHAQPQDLDHIYGHPHSGTLLHIAAQNNSPSLVQLLVNAGASPKIKDLRGKKYTPLHYAVQNGNHETVKILLSKGAEVNSKEGEFGRTSLHLLPLKWKTAEDDYKECLDEILRQPKAKIDSRESSGATPLFLAAQKGWEYMTRLLILKGASLELAVGSKKVSDVVKKKFPGLLDSIDLSKVEQLKRFYGDELYEAMKEGEFDTFRNTMDEVNEKEASSKKAILEEDHGDYTLMNYACQNGMTEYVEVLLKEGASPTSIDQTTKYSPILYAARNGHYRIMECLTESMKKSNYMEKGSLKTCDRRGETALHKVVKREQPSDGEGVDYQRCLEILLNFKRYLNIDAQDEFNNTPLHYAVLCDDQRFVRLLLINGAHLGLKNSFGTLAISRIQPNVLEGVLDDCVKHRNNITDRDFEIVLQYSMLAPANVENQPETECLKFLSSSSQHKRLLRHPIIDTFLYLKWQRIRHYYFINLLAYAAFLTLLTLYIILVHGSVSTSEPDENVNTTDGNLLQTSDKASAKISLQILILLFWFFIAFRELTQMVVSFKKYFKSLENWLELSILVMTVVLLLIPMPHASQQGLSAWLVLCGWIELVLVLGRHPWFAVYITMFTTVTSNFLKFILMFSFMIVAFSLSFFLVFQINDNFITYPKTLLKTIAMSTGEIEYTDLPLSDYPVSSHLLFVIFVFLIVLVLMNLLNGLAVSDIQAIQQEAELVSYISRVELISYIESVFLANPFQNVRICGEDSCCFRISQGSTNPAFRVLNYLGKRTLMFHNCLRDHQVTVFPNRGRDRWHVCSCHSFQLQESQIEAAKSVVLADSSRVADALAGLESRVDSVIESLSSLSELVKKNLVRPINSD